MDALLQFDQLIGHSQISLFSRAYLGAQLLDCVPGINFQIMSLAAESLQIFFFSSLLVW